MNRERFARLREILARATELPKGERAAYLDEACGEDTELRQEAEAILARECDSPSFLGTDGELADVTDDRETVLPDAGNGPQGPTHKGPYRILERIGEGGFGEVFAAEQSEPVKRRVALKILKAGLDTREVLARFEAERQALAMMDHPNVCRVLDAGETPHGRPYFVMELLHGEPLIAYCDHHRLTMEERLDLFVPVCHAIQHAHQKGVIHRDVKPSNVLVTLVDGKPVPKVIDFGIAKATAQTLTEKTLYTLRGQVVGTPAYMSPEQAELTGLDVDTRTDVYSLGVLLYELLTGRLPFETKTLQEAGLDEMRRIIREKEPPKPSTRVSTLGEEAKEAAARRRTDPAHWRKALRRELDWIVMKSLEKDRSRRYETVGGLAADVGRYLADEPVLAGPPSTVYRMQKYVKRHRVAVGFAGLVAAGVVLAFVLVTLQNARIAAARDEAEAARDEAEAVTGTLEEMLASVDPTKSGRDVTVKEMLDQTAKTLGEKFEDQPLIEARLRRTMGNTYFELGEYDSAEGHLQRAVEIRIARLGENDPATLAARSRLAWTYRRQGRYEESETLFREILRQRVPGREDVGMVEAMNGLASALSTRGQYDEAEALYEETLEVCRRVLGEEHGHTLGTMGNVALIYGRQGRFDEAEALQRQTLELARRALGEQNPWTLSFMTGLASTYEQQGRHEEAEAVYRESLAIQRRVLGEAHSDTRRTVVNLAQTLAKQGRHEEAEALGREYLETLRRERGPDNYQTLRTTLSLAMSTYEEGRYEEAEELFREAWEGFRRTLGPESLVTLEAMGNLALAHWVQGCLEEAAALWRDVVTIGRRSLGEEHAVTRNAMFNLAFVYCNLGRHAESDSLNLANLEISRRVLGEDHRRTNDLRFNLACHAALRGDRDEAISYLREALDNGYDGGNMTWILDDPEVASLRGDPEAEAIAEEMRRRRDKGETDKTAAGEGAE